MKVLSILLIFIGACMILAYGIIFLLGFAMSFDAPGSDTDPKAWVMRMGMFLPIILGIVLLVLAFLALRSGNYGRSVFYGIIIPIAGAAFWGYMFYDSSRAFKAYKQQEAKSTREAEMYPKQTYIRPSANGGTDTIIVWPDRIVAYRLFMGEGNPEWGGPLGDLNDGRDTLIYYDRQDTRLRRDELDQFVDRSGRRFSDVYSIK